MIDDAIQHLARAMVNQGLISKESLKDFFSN